MKCELALMKLKSIFAYTMDYKMILESYKKGLAAASAGGAAGPK